MHRASALTLTLHVVCCVVPTLGRIADSPSNTLAASSVLADGSAKQRKLVRHEKGAQSSGGDVRGDANVSASPTPAIYADPPNDDKVCGTKTSPNRLQFTIKQEFYGLEACKTECLSNSLCVAFSFTDKECIGCRVPLDYPAAGNKGYRKDPVSLQISVAGKDPLWAKSTADVADQKRLAPCTPTTFADFTACNEASITLDLNNTDEVETCQELARRDNRCTRYFWHDKNAKSCKCYTAACPDDKSTASVGSMYKMCLAACTQTWSAWSDCPETCGKGTRHRNATGHLPAWGYQACPPVPFAETCLRLRCEGGDCTPKFSAWGECSKKCGTGVRHRTLLGTNQSGFKEYCNEESSVCSVPEKCHTTSETCNTQPCESDF